MRLLLTQIIATMACMASYSRSQRRCKFQKLIAIYFKSCGLSAKAFDTANALGISMSQRWTYDGTKTLACTAQQSLREDIEEYPWFGSHDNLNRRQRAYQQRLDNQNHFESGVAGTIYIIKDPDVVRPSLSAYNAQRQRGSENPISYADIIQLELDAAPRQEEQALYRILNFVASSEPFDFDSYEHKSSSIFCRPPPVFQLPCGAAHRTCQYMLDTSKIDPSSYEGNIKSMEEWWRQLGINGPEAQRRLANETVLPWIGDQLTASRLRGIIRMRARDLNCAERVEQLVVLFGWLHFQMTVGQSIHAQYYGTADGMGLRRDFDLLKRRGLAKPSVQGTFHSTLCEALWHIAAARFRDIFCIVAKVEKIEELRRYTPEELREFAKVALEQYATTRTLYEHRSKPRTKQDDIFLQAIQFNRDILNFLDLDDAMEFGDVGRMRDILPRMLFRFVGDGNSNYTQEVLELLQGLEREFPEDLV